MLESLVGLLLAIMPVDNVVRAVLWLQQTELLLEFRVQGLGMQQTELLLESAAGAGPCSK